MATLSEGIEHICQLIKSQQDYAVQAEIVEEVDLIKRLEEALDITDHGLGSDPNLSVIREFEEPVQVALDKHKLLEILVNLIQNARQAMAASRDQRVLKLGLSKVRDDRVRITVTDSGMGIAPDNLVKVFSLGFTTRRDGHGYGLHTAAVAARDLGGELWAESAGEGYGATFVLELPVPSSSKELVV